MDGNRIVQPDGNCIYGTNHYLRKLNSDEVKPDATDKEKLRPPKYDTHIVDRLTGGVTENEKTLDNCSSDVVGPSDELSKLLNMYEQFATGLEVDGGIKITMETARQFHRLKYKHGAAFIEHCNILICDNDGCVNIPGDLKREDLFGLDQSVESYLQLYGDGEIYCCQ